MINQIKKKKKIALVPIIKMSKVSLVLHSAKLLTKNRTVQKLFHNRTFIRKQKKIALNLFLL